MVDGPNGSFDAYVCSCAGSSFVFRGLERWCKFLQILSEFRAVWWNELLDFFRWRLGRFEVLVRGAGGISMIETMREDVESLALRLNGLRCDGNQLFAQRNYEEAIEHYTRCITECLEATTKEGPVEWGGREEEEEVGKEANGEQSGKSGAVEQNGDQNSAIQQQQQLKRTLQLAFSNRAESHLRLRNFRNALLDAERALELDPNNAKSLNRRGKAYEGLEEFELAHHSFAAAHKLAPKQDLDIEKAMKRTKICMQQTTSGEYNLSDFYLSGCKGPLIPCCDFVGPVQISKVKNAGRGLIVTKDVAAGELLFVSNAIAMAFILPEPSLLHQGLHYQSEHEDEHLISKLAEVARCSPKARKQLYSLAFDNCQLDMRIPSMDLFRPGGEWTTGYSIEESAEVDVDILRIWGVAHYSALNLYGHTADISEYYDSERARRRGLWPLAAFMNHSCVPNCLRMHIGNAMFVRAARHIAAGEELTVNYFGLLDSLDTRQESAKEWGFQCTCSRCEFEQGIAALERLERRFNDLIRVKPSWQDDEETVVKPQVSPKDVTALYYSAEDIVNSRVNLQPEQRYWIIASCIYAYVAQAAALKTDPKQRIVVLWALVDSITAVSAANVWGLEYSCDLLREVALLHGRSSEEYVKTEKRVIEIFRTAYGAQTSRKALEALIQYFHESAGSVHSCDRC
ncbi:unnamed protein product [Calypogeia fissa]